MVKIRAGRMEKVFYQMAERLGVVGENDTPTPALRSAVFLARIDMAEYISDVIGKDDISPAAQRIRAALRKM